MSRASFQPILRLTVATLLAASASASASISVDMDFGALRDASGTIIASTHPNPALRSAMWVLIYDQNDDGVLPGGLSTTSLADPAETTGHSLAPTDSATAHDAFADTSLAVGTIIGGDRVLAIGDTNPGFFGLVSLALNVLDFPGSGLVPRCQYGLYWFPGASSSSPTLPSGSFQVGGINEIINHTGAIGTKIPNDGSSFVGGVLDDDFGGSLPATRFQAITAQSPTFSSWIAGFPDIGSHADFGDDPDRDGLENGVEAALGSRPDTANAGVLTISAGSSLVARSSRAKPALADVTTNWQWSADLVNWHASGGSNGSSIVVITETVTDAGNPDFDVTMVEAEVTSGTLDHLFLRLSANHTP